MNRFRNKAVTLLEIGVYHGGSLNMWQRYFGPDAKIHGIDINPECMAHQTAQISVHIGDQADRKFLQAILASVSTIDIVIDDGGHRMDQQLIAFEEIYPRMSPHGVYILEDTHTSYWSEWGGGYGMHTFIEAAKQRINQLHAWHYKTESFAHFGTPPEKRDHQLDVPQFTRTTASITFYDSVVVFERSVIPEPYHLMR